MEDEEVERLYSPSRWSKRYGPEEVIIKHTDVTTAESEKAKASVPNQPGLRYGPGEAQMYDMYGEEALPADAPLFIYIHGGYWQALDRTISSYCVQPLYKAGIKVAILGYTLAPKARLENIVNEIRSGVQLLVTQASQQGCRGVWVGGHSAGAHLAITALLCSPRPSGMQLVRGLVLISGVYQLAPLLRTSVNEALQLDKERAEQLSPLTRLSTETLPAWARRLHVLLAVAEHDSPAFVQQSRDMTKALESRVQKVELVIMPGLDHFDIVEKLSDPGYALSRSVATLVTGK